jgi:ABC-type dipeptide/oligopeptide/nickel transport system permease component
MLEFILRRLLALPLVMIGVTLLVVGLMQLLSPTQRAAAFVKNEKQLRNLPAIVREQGLDQPFLVQYGRWLGNAAQGNWGYSKSSNKPVLQTIQERFPATLELALFAVIPVIGLGIWLGTKAALEQDRWLDQSARLFAVLSWNIPVFVSAIWLLVLFYGVLGVLPGFGQLSSENQIAMLINGMRRYTGLMTVDALLNGQWGILFDALKHLVLPVLTLSLVSCANFLTVMRASLLEVLGEDYVRTAKAKGLSEAKVNLRHARRNALLPMVTLAGGTVTGLMSGAVITESIFAYPGIGSWGADAAAKLDYAGVLGFAVFVAFLVVLGNLLTDIMYGFVDPRVRFE